MENEQAIHKKFAVDCFNKTWSLIDLETRTAEQDDDMLALTMASYWHWTQREDFTPKNASIAFWQIARVHALRGEGEMALKFGRKAIDVIPNPEELPFFVAYGWAEQARGALLLEDHASATTFLSNAQALLPAIDPDDLALITPDLEALATQLTV